MNTPFNSGHVLHQSIVVTVANVMRIVNVDDIVFLEADDNYTFIHLQDRQRCLVCKTLKRFEGELCETHFIRCHKSFMINLLFVREIRLTAVNLVCLTTGEKIPISRRRLSGLRKAMK